MASTGWSGLQRHVQNAEVVPGRHENNTLFCIKHIASLPQQACLQSFRHTPSLAFWHLPPNSARTGSAIERGHSYLRPAVHRCCQRPPENLGTNKTVKAT